MTFKTFQFVINLILVVIIMIAKMLNVYLLALIEVEILVARGSGGKIETQSRNNAS
ncbi:hypothetical protein CLU83_3995 [Flavobacterium sp. 1]|nr:hypothetical protein CLU83_3995 [Flavobacterium sp. 1]